MWLYQPIPSIQEPDGPIIHSGSVELVGAGMTANVLRGTLATNISLVLANANLISNGIRIIGGSFSGVGECVIIVNGIKFGAPLGLAFFSYNIFDSFIESID